MYAEIVVDARTSIPGDRFTYEVPPHLDLRAGHLVRVPFGRRTIHGVVAWITSELRVDYVRPVAGLLHPEPVMDDLRMELAAWIAGYYMAPMFDAIAPFLPPGFRTRARPALSLTAGAPDDGTATPKAIAAPEATEGKRLTPGALRLLAYLQAHPRPHQIAGLARTLGPWVPNAARALIESGVAQEQVIEPRPHPVSRGSRVVRGLLSRAELIERADQMTRAPRQAALARRLAEPTSAPYAASEARTQFGAAALVALVSKGLAEIASEAVESQPPGTRRIVEPPLLPTASQVAALGRINAAQDDPTLHPRTFLLRGVTGSGKTEVYLQALAHCLELGRRAIVLVPELSLTPQTVRRFEARFPGQVGLIHSALSPARHWDEWWAVREGRRGVVVGARSALFAPQAGLCLIILDEEHEWTYKQVDASPRYHARDVARELARITGAVVVLGSATPDVVSAHATERGAYTRLRLPERIERSGAPASLAHVQVVDMREELKAGNRSVFSRPLQEGLRHVVAAREQAILFLNRRGSAGIVECRDCGHVMRCYRCGTPYTLHGGNAAKASADQPRRAGREKAVSSARPGMLLCHHCNHRRRPPVTCPNCRSRRIRSIGLGTQRLVEEVTALVPQARVLRWDRDTAASPAAHAALLERFEAGDADVLVGTQMIAKGLDIATVTLVGVVLADLGLHLPDFRAPERTFQLVTQVAGRAGRGATAGEVIIQSYAPEHYAVAAAAQQDYDAFYAREMEYRSALGNPPFGRLIRLTFGHGEERTARTESERLGALLRRTAREWDMGEVDVTGPAPGYPPRWRGAWRWNVFLRGPDPRMLLDKINVPPGWTVDVDPVSVV